MNVLYIGVENPISFAVENTNCSELTIGVENGSAKRTGECEYDVEVTKPGRTFIFIIKGNDTLYKAPYRVKHIPNPIIDGVSESYGLLDRLRSKSSLSTIEQFEFDASFRIVSFDIMIVRNGKMPDKGKIYCRECFKRVEDEYYEIIFSEKNEGGEFNDLLKEFIQHKLMPGDKVFFENIKALAPDNRIRQLRSIIFYVQ